MQLSSDTPPAKRSRAKAKSDTPDTPKKPRVSKKAASKPVAAEAEPLTATTANKPGADALAGEIATTAYFIAAQRNFAPGQELNDWLTAERIVLGRYA